MTKDCLKLTAEDRVEISTQLKFVLESTFKDKKISANNNTYIVYKTILYIKF